MRRTQVPFLPVVLTVIAFAAAACGKKPPAPAPAAPAKAPAPAKIVPKPEPPPPPLTPAQKSSIAADYDAARKVVLEARDLRMKGEVIEREKGREAANDTLVAARKKYRQAAQLTERWVEPELREITQKQLDKDPELRAYFEERGKWIQEDASMGAKLNAR